MALPLFRNRATRQWLIENANIALTLLNSAIPDKGTLTPSFARAGAKYHPDFEGRMYASISGEWPFRHVRRVRNLLTNTEALDNASWTKTNITVDTGASDPDGLTTAFTITATAANGEIYRSTGVSTLSGVASIYVKRRIGSGAIQLWDGNNFEAIPVDSSWQRLSVSHTVSSTLYLDVRIVVAGDAVDVWHPQCEDVTGQSVQTASEYVSVGALDYRSTQNPLYLSLPGTAGHYASTPDSVAA